MSAPRLVLASTSRYRKELLERLGLPFRCYSPGVDESAYRGQLAPEQLARTLARAKAERVAADEKDALVIGSDQVCALGDEVFEKPGSADRAVLQLSRMAGQTHRLLTAVTVVGAGARHEFLDETRLTMRPLSIEQIERYVAHDQPFDCAGSYKLESLGVALFERIEGSDQTAVTGLPLIALVGVLAELGVVVP